MKNLLRQYLFFAASIFLVAKVIPGLSYSNNWQTLAEASFLLFVVHFLVRPVVNLVALPINVLTLGLFSFVINGLMLYLVTLVISSFKVTAFDFPSVNLGLVSFNTFYVAVVPSYIVIAFLVGLVKNGFQWLCSK